MPIPSGCDLECLTKLRGGWKRYYSAEIVRLVKEGIAGTDATADDGTAQRSGGSVLAFPFREQAGFAEVFQQ